MVKGPMRPIFSLLLLILPSLVIAESLFETPFSASRGQKTPTYVQTVDWLVQVADATPHLSFGSFGISPEGRDLPVVVADLRGRFTAAEHRERGDDEVVLLVEACIHAGESCGKDAGMLLLQELATDSRAAAELLERVTLVFIPIFNVDGHERFGPYNRINQNGPDEMGWRVNSLNQNLNRDFLKADTPEMRAWLELFKAWDPDFFIDIHSTDGADYQYPVTYGLELHGNMDAGLTEWTAGYRDRMVAAMEEAGLPMAPYVSFKDWHDPRSGLTMWAAGPRFSQGYAAIRNRPGLLIETHMLKDYPTRVEGTRRLWRETMLDLNGRAHELRRRIRQADEHSASEAFRREPFALTLKGTETHRPFEFRGVAYEKVTSSITGGDWFRFHTDQPETWTVEMYDEMVPDRTVLLPELYIVPAQWAVIIDRLRWHGVRFQVLEEPVTVEVRTHRFGGAKWRERPYEGHHPVSFEVEELTERREFPAGSVVVDMNQPLARVAAHLLEPEGPDSMVRWGYLDAIFERVEYVESYVIEDMIRQMVAQDPDLLARLEEKKAAEPEFAADPWAIRFWFYKQTPYYDQRVGMDPVGRVFDRSVMKGVLR